MNPLTDNICGFSMPCVSDVYPALSSVGVALAHALYNVWQDLVGGVRARGAKIT